MKKNYFLLSAIGLLFSTVSIAQTYNFTAAGATGRFGPTQPQIDAAYTATTLAGAVTINTQGIQEWVVPFNGNYEIEVAGAGEDFSTGANLSGEFTLTAGQVIFIAVGHQATTSGGHGGTFVATGTNLATTTPMIVGGGGGGNTNGDYNPVLQAASFANAGNNGNVGYGGTLGNGGQTNVSNTTYGGGGGGGFYSNGVNTSNYGDVGRGFQQGAIGGDMSINSANTNGAFGGGGSGYTNNEPAGGGGYSGGGGGGAPNDGSVEGPNRFGGGGGSFNSGSNPINIGTHIGYGYVTITLLCTPLTTTVSSSNVCLGDQVTLHAESTNGGTISWNNGITDNVAFTPSLGTTTYTASSSDGNDCSFDAIITVNALPVVDAGTDIYQCDTTPDITLSGAGAVSYIWDNGVTDGMAFTPNFGTTIYTVTGTDANNCEASDMVNVSIGGPTVTAVITNESLPGNGAIDITVTGGSGTYTYSWSNGPSTQDINNLIAGTYTVNVNDGTCITDTSFTVLNTIGAGIAGHSDNLIQVYPNPTNGIVNIQLVGEFNYELINLAGQILMTDNGVNKLPINLEELPKGAYFLNVIQENQSKVFKIVKQ